MSDPASSQKVPLQHLSACTRWNEDMDAVLLSYTDESIDSHQVLAPRKTSTSPLCSRYSFGCRILQHCVSRPTLFRPLLLHISHQPQRASAKRKRQSNAIMHEKGQHCCCRPSLTLTFHTFGLSVTANVVLFMPEPGYHMCTPPCCTLTFLSTQTSFYSEFLHFLLLIFQQSFDVTKRHPAPAPHAQQIHYTQTYKDKHEVGKAYLG